MKPMAFLGAVAASVFGAGMWAAVALVTGYEIGIVAWAVGGMVGFGAHLLGGRGTVTGVVCAVLAIGSIFCGKIMGYQLALNNQVDSWLEASVTPENYQAYMREVKAYDDVKTEYDIQEYMVTFGYTEARYPYQVSKEEMDEFLANSEPEIKRAVQNPPSYEEWEADKTALMKQVKDSLSGSSLVQSVLEDLNLFDVIFAMLGIATAFKVGATGMERLAA